MIKTNKTKTDININIKKIKKSGLKLLENCSFCVFDLETTGGNLKQDQIIEIGLVKIENLKITDTKHYLIRPYVEIPIFIQKLTSIYPADLEDCQIIEDIIDDLLSFMGDSILVAHNTSFDIPFFNSVLTRLKRPTLQNKNICTNLMAKYMIPGLLSTNLAYMSKIFNIRHGKAHRAMDDAKATAKLLIKFLDIFIDKDIKKINHLYYPKNKYELNTTHFQYNESIEKLKTFLTNRSTPFLITVKGDKGIIIFAYPSIPENTDIDFIISKIKNIKYSLITIKIFGNLLETLVSFNGLFLKLDSNLQNDIIKQLFKTQNIIKIKKTVIINKHFIIVPHLVSDQYLIYSATNFHQNAGLIFKYPKHNKKLFQYIKSRINLKPNKKKPFWASELNNFINEYLNKLLNECRHNSNYLIFSKNDFTDQKAFQKMLDQSLDSVKINFIYPKEYI